MTIDTLYKRSHINNLFPTISLYSAITALICIAFSFIPAANALAEDLDTDPQADEFQQEVERTAAEYEEAKVNLAQANADVKENEEHIAVISAQIPEQQVRGGEAARELYKLRSQRSSLISLLMSSENFYNLLENLDYITRISDSHMAELERLSEMKRDLEEHQTALEKAQSEAKKQADNAKKALQAAQEKRTEAQARAQEEARRQAEEAAAQAAAEAEAQKAAEESKAEAEKQEQQEPSKSENSTSKSNNAESKDASDKKSDESSSDDKDNNGEQEQEQDQSQKQEQAQETSESGSSSASSSADDGANWSDDQAAFISEWSGRINNYLAGSALDGQGENFAKAAWTYGVDPRWSPAIAFTESTLGANCFNPYNAWGWGDVSWSSWEEAIDSHVRGLARGYGYTISIENAQKYCPPNWEHWYNTTLEQMNRI